MYLWGQSENSRGICIVPYFLGSLKQEVLEIHTRKQRVMTSLTPLLRVSGPSASWLHWTTAALLSRPTKVWMAQESAYSVLVVFERGLNELGFFYWWQLTCDYTTRGEADGQRLGPMAGGDFEKTSGEKVLRQTLKYFPHYCTNSCKHVQKHVCGNTNEDLHAVHWNVSVNDRIVRFGLPPLPHFFSRSWCARTNTRTQTNRRPIVQRLWGNTRIAEPTFIPASAPSRPPPELIEALGNAGTSRVFWSLRARKREGVFYPLTPFVSVSQPCRVLSALLWTDRLTMSEQARKHERKQSYVFQLSVAMKKGI